MAGKSRFPFTNGRLQKLPVPDRGRQYHYDEKAAGLCLCVTSADSRTFYLYRKIDGRPERIRLGKFPETSIDAARKTAAELVGEIAAGRDPASERRARRTSPTLANLFTHWMETHAKLHKKSWQEDERQYRAFLKPWAGRRLGKIKKTDVQALHAKVGKASGIYAANRLLALLRAMFNKAGDLGWTGANPTAGVRKFKESSRDRFLQPEELKQFFMALADEEPIFRDFFVLALFTGARRSNVQAMRWEEINFQAAVWRIPDTKGGQPVIVPLVEPAVSILRSRLEASDGSPWVFPTHSKVGHLVEPKTAWKRICEKASLRNLRVHDLRRTMGSWQVATGATLPIIGKMLGHTQESTTAIYARLQVDTVRESAEKAVAAMVEAAGVKLIEDKGVDDG